MKNRSVRKITQEEALHWFRYDANLGALIWARKRPGRGCVVGAEAGTISVKGYRVITFKQKKIYAHHIVWIAHRGAMPEGFCIDHVDGNPLNNRIENLRLATLSENQRNSRRPKSNTTGEMNIRHHKKGFFEVFVAGKQFGSFQTMASAKRARDKAHQEMSCHPNHGRS